MAVESGNSWVKSDQTMYNSHKMSRQLTRLNKQLQRKDHILKTLFGLTCTEPDLHSFIWSGVCNFDILAKSQ
jgi:hypothetical protein